MNQKDKEQSNQNIDHIFQAIKAPIAALGYTIQVTDLNGHNEKTDTNRILITDTTLPLFKIEILGREWNDHNKASLWLNTDKTINTQIPNYYSDGTSNTISKRYEFDSYLDYKYCEEIGLEKSDYRYQTCTLRKGFKATKSAKLLLNDILPILKMYRLIVEHVSPKIELAIARDESTLNLQRFVEAYTNHPQALYETKNRTFRTEIGEIEISSYGSITLKQELTSDQLIKLLDGVTTK